VILVRSGGLCPILDEADDQDRDYLNLGTDSDGMPVRPGESFSIDDVSSLD
jgi:hypothetical protein